MAPRRVDLRHLVLVLVAALVLARLAGMAALPLMDTTEARYGEIGRKMAELGDWVTPWHDDGVPFWGKPPLSFWLTAISLRLLGVSEFAARLPHFICLVLVALLAWDLKRRHDAPEALAAVAVLAGSLLFFVSAGAVMTDGALVLGATLAMHAFWRAMHAEAPAQRRCSGWLFFIGLAIGLLAKGPLTLVLVGTPLLLWTAWTRRWSEVLCGLPWVAGFALMLLISVPWYVLAERRTPGFLQYFIVGEHWHRFVTPGWKGDLYGTAHRFAPGTMWLFTAAALLPWTIVLPLAACTSRRGTVAEVGGTRQWNGYLWLWALAPLLFFTPARNIIWTYPLPALPATALLIAGWLIRRPRAQAWLAAGLSTSLVLFLAGWGIGHRFGLIEQATARSIVQAYEREHAPGQPLLFMGSRPYSAAFYSRDHAGKVERAQDIAADQARNGAFVALRPGSELVLREAGLDIDRRVGQFGMLELVLLRPLRMQIPVPADDAAQGRRVAP